MQVAYDALETYLSVVHGLRFCHEQPLSKSMRIHISIGHFSAEAPILRHEGRNHRVADLE